MAKKVADRTATGHAARHQVGGIDQQLCGHPVPAIDVIMKVLQPQSDRFAI
jgi:hypothetical protein